MEDVVANLRRTEDARAYSEILLYGTHAMVLRLIKILGHENDGVLKELMSFTHSSVEGSADRLMELKRYLFGEVT